MYLVIFLFGVINYQKLMAAPQTPSQALPKMFQKPPGLDYYQFKKQDKVVPELPEIEIKQQEDVGTVIRLSSIIILAPKEFTKYYFSRKISDEGYRKSTEHK